MHYRILGKTGIKVSILGFGCMRLPTIKPFQPAVKQDEAIKIIRKGIDLGINFVDTAYGYHDMDSEIALGKALKDGYREKVTLMTKSPVWHDEFTKGEDFERYLDGQLKRIGVKYIDIYLFHSLNEKLWREKVLNFGLIERAKKAKAAGKIKHIGISFHDKPELLKEIIDTGEFEIMLVQYNLLDRDIEKMIEYGAKQGLGIIVMEPIFGGRLAGEPPKELRAFLNKGQKNFVDYALKFVWTNPNVSLALSGMGSEQMVDQNVALASSKIYTLSSKEMEKTKEIAKKYKELTDNICTNCKYFMPCPNDVNIPIIFSALMYHDIYGQKEKAKHFYSKIGDVDWPPGKRADACTECCECEPKCPQKIPIIKQLKYTHELLAK